MAPGGLNCREAFQKQNWRVIQSCDGHALTCFICAASPLQTSSALLLFFLSPSSLLQYWPCSMRQWAPRTPFPACHLSSIHKTLMICCCCNNRSHSSAHRLCSDTTDLASSRFWWSISGTSCRWPTLRCQGGWEMSAAPFTERSTFYPARWRGEAGERMESGTSRGPILYGLWRPAAGSPSAGSHCAASSVCPYADARHPTPPLL